MPDDNVEIVRRSHALYRAGELDAAIDQYLDPDIEWETRWPGLEPWFYGRDGVREWVRRALQPMEIEMELIDARAIDQEVVLAEYRLLGQGRGSNVPTEMKIFDLLWLRSGMIYRRRTFYTEQDALEASGAAGRRDG
jgi:ketosteroid isomerase-like protein